MPPVLVRHAAWGRTVSLAPEVLRALLDYPWPGNVRELENVVERLAYVSEGGTVRLHDLPAEMLQTLRPRDAFSWPEGKTLEEVERAYIHHVLARCAGNKVQAAQILGINRKTIQRKLGEPEDAAG